MKAWNVTGEFVHSKAHDIRLKQPKQGGEGSLPMVLWFDEDVVVSSSYVELGKDQ